MRLLVLVTLLGACAARPGMMRGKVNHAACPFSKHKHSAPSATDTARAGKASAAGSHVGGVSHKAIASKINTHMHMHHKEIMKPCDSFSLEGLNGILRKLLCHASEKLEKLQKGTRKGLRHDGADKMAAYEHDWAHELTRVTVDPSVAPLLREAKCAEALQIFTHHLHETGKEAFTAEATKDASLRLPTLPVFKADFANHADAKLGSTYKESLSCVSGHNETAGHTSDHQWPHWPAEVHYTGMGHGAYPFWLGPGGGGGSGAPIEVWYSETKMAEKFYHSSCSMTEAGASKNQPCYHLFRGGVEAPEAYLYTATEDFCCISGNTGAGPGERLSIPTSDFMDAMVLNASYGKLKTPGTYYDGPVKQYLMTLPFSEPVTYFWYITDMNDKPVQQGEGGFGGAGILIYHEYNTTSFKATTHDPSVFAVPEVCKKTRTKCEFP